MRLLPCALALAALSPAAAHDGAHAALALRGVTLGQLGPMEVSCVSAAPGSGARVSEIQVANDIDMQIKLVAVHNDGSKAACTSPHTGVGVIGDSVDFRLAVDEFVDYVVVLGEESHKQAQMWKDVHEIWRALDGTKKVWPPSVQIWSSAESAEHATEMDDEMLARVLREALV